MLEVILAAWVPAAAGYAIASRFRNGEHRRAYLCIAAVVLLWMSPCWLFGRSPVAFDYLFEDVTPWKLIEGSEFESHGSLLTDVPLQFVPWRTVVTDALRRGELPYLNRFAGSGTPLLENPQSATFALATILGLPFSSFAWPVFAATLRLLLAVTGMYIFLRGERLHALASMTGAFAWGLCAYNIAFLEFPHVNASSLLPWLLVAIRAVVSSGRWEASIAGAVCVAMIVAGGHPESVLHIAFLAIPFAAALAWRLESRRSAIVGLALIGVLGMGLAAPLVIPFAAYLPFTERMAWLDAASAAPAVGETISEAVLPFVFPAHFLHTATQNWQGSNFNEIATQYAGLATVLLAVVGFAARRSRLRFWIAAFVVLFLLELFATRELLHDIPVLGWTANGRLRFVLAFIVAVAAAHGLDRLLQEPLGRRERIAWAGVGLFLAGAIALIAAPNIGLYQVHDTAQHVIRSIFAALISLGAVLFVLWRPESRVRFAIPVLIAIDLFALMGTYNPPVDRKYFYPPTPAIAAVKPADGPSRVFGIWDAAFPNTGAMIGVEQVNTHDPLAFEPYLRVLDRAGLDRSHYFNTFRRLPPRAMLDFLGVRHVIAPAGFPAPELDRIHAGLDGWVYRNARAQTRFFVPSRVVAVPDPVDALFRSADGRVAFVKEGSHVVSATRLELVEYSGSSARLDIDAEGDSFIASSEVALPGWSLELDGERWPLEVINGVFLGWRVPPGRHSAVLAYRPEGWELSVSLFALSLAVTLFLAGRLLSKHPKVEVGTAG